MLEITESKMIFGPYDDADVFEIERSAINEKAGNNISTVEFILKREENKIMFIEAKSSSPRESTDKEKYGKFISDITDKFLHSFELYQALLYERYETHVEIGSNLKELDWKIGEIKFVLVIKGHEKEWLVPIREALIKEMQSFSKIWKSDIIVLNDDMAKDKSIISATIV